MRGKDISQFSKDRRALAAGIQAGTLLTAHYEDEQGTRMDTSYEGCHSAPFPRLGSAEPPQLSDRLLPGHTPSREATRSFAQQTLSTSDAGCRGNLP